MDTSTSVKLPKKEPLFIDRAIGVFFFFCSSAALAMQSEEKQNKTKNKQTPNKKNEKCKFID